MNNSRHWCYFPQFSAPDLAGLISSWKQETPDMGLLAMIAEKNREDVRTLQAACRDAGVTVIGAIFPALLVDTAFQESGIILFCQPQMPEYFLRADICPASGGSDLAAEALDLLGDEEGGTLFMIFDAMVPNIATLLDQIYLQLADSVNYAGINAGSETFQPMPCLFDGERLVQNGVLAIWFKNAPPALLEHGYPLPDRIITVTTSKGNCIETIDWRPAFEVYRELAQQQYGLDITKENFYELAVHFPFGIVRARGEVLVRIPVALTDSGALFCVGEVPENSVLTLLEGSEEDLLAGVQRLADKVAALDCRETMTFYCAGRKMHLGHQKATVEIEKLAEQTGPLSGAVTLGEIGNFEGGDYPLFHNATLVCFPWTA